VHAFDVTTGVITVDAGLDLDALMRMAVPFGWFVPVTPGTRYVTVGGALAADIHGKNHHVDGSFANHVESFVVQTPKGDQRVTPNTDPELFWTTAGAMGLTGVVTELTLRLIPIETAYLSVDTERGTDVDDVMARMVANDDQYRYSVAWVDCVPTGAGLGRGILMRGDHARVDQLPKRRQSRALVYSADVKLAAPPWMPSGLLNHRTIGAMNEVWFRKAPKHRTGHIESIPTFFHPLDFIAGWNRAYGTRGFVQYQYVVPDAAADAVLRSLEIVSRGAAPSFVSVLKRFGPGNPGPLSFPAPGWTLALDFPAGTPDLAALLRTLDELVIDAGGRVYLAKDARMTPDVVRRMYPHLDRLAAVRDRVDPNRVMQSDLARRLQLP
jgi:decaprenylphospho-beta-D-ribofuranose 2-oxidase